MERTEKGTFATGHKGLKPKGSKHKSTELRMKLDEIISNEMENLPTLLASIEKPEIRAKLLIDLLPYKIPKLQNIEYSHEVLSQIQSLSEDQLKLLVEQVKLLLSDESYSGNEYLQRLFSHGEPKMKLPSWIKEESEVVTISFKDAE